MSENKLTNGTPDTVAAALLQEALLELVALRFRAKQAHWNVRGTNFRDVHLELDEIVSELDQWIDDSAERIVALGVAADVRPAEIASGATVAPIEAGFVNDLEAIAALSEQMTIAIAAMRGTVAPLEIEPVTQDLVIGILHGLEKRNWMLRSRAG